MDLTVSQSQAISHVEGLSDGPPIGRSLRVTINFHPDRLHNGVHLLESIAQEGIYKSQFETGSSNGGLTAHPGGDRWNWESRIFGTAYDHAVAKERPKYGALNYKRYPFGASPRFGSAYFRLVQGVVDRCTFCYPDSVYEPTAFGTAQRCNLMDLAQSDSDKDILDDYIEAQIHGDLVIPRDVEALVLDPSYRGTEVEHLARQLKCPIEWHDGYILTIEDMEKYPEYRGAEYIALGREIAVESMLTPYIVGQAAVSGKYDLQSIKKVWHYVARFGRCQPVVLVEDV